MSDSSKQLLDLFKQLYNAGCEADVHQVIAEHAEIFSPSGNWRPLGGIDNNFGVVENQQSSPIASLIEKLTNSIDAILMRRCAEEGIDPKSEHAPRSMEEAVVAFFPKQKLWDYAATDRRIQAERIQILADGPKGDTSLIIYDDGEGQHPEAFESTFLSLLKGNKNDIHFVQGKYNMGGSGAIDAAVDHLHVRAGRTEGHQVAGLVGVGRVPVAVVEPQLVVVGIGAASGGGFVVDPLANPRVRLPRKFADL